MLSGLKPRGVFALVFLVGLAVPQGRAAYADAGRALLSTSSTAAPGGLVAPVAGDCRRLSDAELAAVVRRHWPPAERVRAFAVALGESGGKPCAVGDVALQGGGWGPSVCLWQIRSRVSEAGTGGLRDQAANLRSVETCATHARQIQLTPRGWRHWSAYTNGTYARHLGRAREALQ